MTRRDWWRAGWLLAVVGRIHRRRPRRNGLVTWTAGTEYPESLEQLQIAVGGSFVVAQFVERRA